MAQARLSTALVFLAAGSGALASPQVTLPYDAAQVVATADQQMVRTLDLNGDGWQDAMGWWLPGSNNVGTMHGWLNDGAGHLELAWQVPFVGSTDDLVPRETITTLDFDLDGDDDWAQVVSSNVRLYLSNGALPPTLAIDFATASSMRAITLGDFDGDGQRELAVAHFDGLLEVFDILLGSGSLQLLGSRSAGIPVVGPLVAAEFTGDGTADLLVSGARVFPCSGGAILPYNAEFGLVADPLTAMFMHDIGDVDGDGDMDAVTFTLSDTGESRTRVLRRVSANQLVADPVSTGGPARILKDIDGDGDLDGVCCGGGGGGISYNDRVSTFRVALNDGTGQFAPAIEWPGLGSRAIAGAVDLDHDGDIDLVAGRNVFYAQGPVEEQPLPDAGIQAWHDPWVGDVDGDGDLDLSFDLDGYQCNLGDGSLELRRLSLPPPPAGMTRMSQAYPGDWDGDGDIDLLAPLGGGFSQIGMELLVNVAPEHFQSAGVVNSTTVLAGSGFARYTLSGDLEGDGDLDLIVQAPIQQKSYLFQNEGSAGFQHIGTVSNALLLALADLDGDGLLDLLGKLSSTNNLRWAKNLGGGAIGPWTVIPGPWLTVGNSLEEQDRIVAADLDADGDIDLATYFDTGAAVGVIQACVLWNQGNATFTQEDLSPLAEKFYPHPVGAWALDVHGNGRLDLLFGPLEHTRNTLAVLLRKGDNSGYLPARDQVMLVDSNTSTWNLRLAHGDLDGDGDPELVAVRCIADMRYDGPTAGLRRQVGTGIPGAGGIAPLLGAKGPFRVGHTVNVRLRGLRPGASGVLTLFSLAAPPAAPAAPSGGQIGGQIGGSPGHLTQTSVVKRIPFVASGASGDPDGSGAWSTAFPVTPGLAGSTWHLEATCVDPSAAGGTSRSNLLILSYGN